MLAVVISTDNIKATITTSSVQYVYNLLNNWANFKLLEVGQVIILQPAIGDKASQLDIYYTDALGSRVTNLLYYWWMLFLKYVN